MPIIYFQTDIYSLLGLAAVIFAAGVGAAWLLTWWRRRLVLPVHVEDPGSMYLLFSRISHRLKTVGEIIRGHLHGFSDELPQDGERWRVARRAISDSASDIDSLVNRLDLVVRLGMSEQPLIFEPVNIPLLLEDRMVDLGPAADSKGILLGGVVSSSNPEESYVISADPEALNEVFSNLLQNAVKHNGSGTVISAEVKHQNGRIQVRIADDGSGMSADVLETIFEKGSRSYRPGRTGGTGMGLYLAKLLIEMHGGDISAHSQDGCGTEFNISLPLRRTEKV